MGKFNKDGTPRKKRTDCGFFRLPPEGQDEFLEFYQRNKATVNIEQLQAILAKYGVTWSEPNIYDFLRSDRLEEQLIASQIRTQRHLGEALADSGADALHTDSRRLAIGHWMTILRCAQVIYADPNTTPEAKSAAYAQASDATDKLVALGALKAGEDKGALALAKLKLDAEKVAQSERKLKLLEERDAKIKAIVNDESNTDYQGKLKLLGKVLEEGFKE